MKKFKTKSKVNYISMIIYLIFLVIFILLSFIKLDKSYHKIVNVLTKEFYESNTKDFYLTNNLDYLINTYYFKDTSKIYDNKQDIILNDK